MRETEVDLKPEEVVEVIPPSACLTQACWVEVFHNGEHEAGKNVTVSPADMDGLADIGELLGPKMDCVSEGMRSENERQRRGGVHECSPLCLPAGRLPLC